MATTINNLDNAMLAGRARYNTFKERNRQRWFAPVIKSAVAMKFAQLPPQVVDALRAADPKRFAEFEKTYLTKE